MLCYNNTGVASAGGVLATEGTVSVDGDCEYSTPQGASPTQAGTYYWVASYSGDANNKEATSGCADEPVLIAQAQPAIATTQDPASGTVGDSFKDQAKLSGLFGAHAGCSVSWKLYSNKSCDASEGGVLASEGPVSVDGDGEFSFFFNDTATTEIYTLSLHDALPISNNKEATSGCADEPVLIAQAQPAIATTQDPASGTVGDSFKDQAKLSGLFGAHAGCSVSWKLYSNKSCDASEGGVLASEGPVSVDGDGEFSFFFNDTATTEIYTLSLHDALPISNNKEATSGCADEPVLIAQAQPAIATTQDPASGKIGRASSREREQISVVAVSLKRNGSWKLYSNKSCDASEGGVLASEGPVSVDGDGEYSTPQGASPTQAGTYYWVASYSGDSNNKEATSGCADEPVLIAQAQPAIATTQDPASGTVGDSFKDQAKLSGLFGAHAGGSVSWKLYSNKSCDASEGGVLASEGPVSVDGDGEYSTLFF